MTAGAVVQMPEKKRVSITSKRQFTIPQKFYTELGFEREALCTVVNGQLVLEPVKEASGDEFAEQILTDLIAEGLSGNELLAEFKARRVKVRPAVEAMLADAKNAAHGTGECFTYEDVFDTEN